MVPRNRLSGAAGQVTVIIATYNRPDTLRVAIRSVVRQTFENWRLLVVGDSCDPATASVVAAFGDERITYHNLPGRFGEQSGPNSVGMAVADTAFLALLNHDDVYLPDHLERALNTLQTTGADLFLGRAAFAGAATTGEDGTKRPVFTMQNAAQRPLHRVFHRNNLFVEPVSTWVFRAAVCRSVGPWNSRRHLYRLPPQDWILRAWRRGTRVVGIPELTVLGISSRHFIQQGAPYYARPSPEHRYLDALLDTGDAEAVRRMVDRDLGHRPEIMGRGRVFGARSPLGRTLVALGCNRLTAALYRFTGLDAANLVLPLAGAERGHGLSATLRLRTGSDHLPEEDYHRLLRRTVAAVRKGTGSAVAG